MTETFVEQRIKVNHQDSQIRNRKDKGGATSVTAQTPTIASHEPPSHSNTSTSTAEGGALVRGLHHGAELCGYLLHPGTVVFGPWCSLHTYRHILLPFKWVSL